MKTITIILEDKTSPKVSIAHSSEEQLKAITPLEYKSLRRALEVAYQEQKRSYRLGQYNVPAHS